jgi:hypothetical protein
LANPTAAALVAFFLGGVWGDWFEHNRVGPVDSAGFIGALLGWASGGMCGAFGSEYVSGSRRPAMIGAAWGLSFLVAGYVGLVAAVYSAEVAKHVLPFLGSRE